MEHWESREIESLEGTSKLKLSRMPECKSLKRKLNTNNPMSTKKVKMDKQDVAEIVSELNRRNNNDLREVLDNNKKDILAALDSKLDPIVSNVAELNGKICSVQETVEEQGKDLVTLKEIVKNLKDQVKEEVLSEVSKGQAQSNLSSYKFTLAAQNEKAGLNLVIHGFKCSDVDIDTRKLIEGLGVPSSVDVKIVSVVRLGKGDGVKPPSILVVVQNQFQRNEILRFSKNLPKGVSVDRDIPIGYRETYKKFRREAWKYKSFFKVSTQIVFSGHLLQLRYKDLDNAPGKAHTIIEEFFPSPDKLVQQIGGNTLRPGSLPSSAVNAATIEAAKEKLLVTGVGGRSKEEVKALLGSLLKTHEAEAITTIETHNGNALLLLNSRTISKQIISQYKNKSVGDFKFNFESF